MSAKRLFQPGNRLGTGGAKPGAGAPRKDIKAGLELANATAKRRLSAKIAAAVTVYENLALKDKDPRVVLDWMERVWPKVQKTEQLGKDGRPLVPVTIIAPDPNGPIPERLTPDPQEAPAKEDMH